MDFCFAYHRTSQQRGGGDKGDKPRKSHTDSNARGAAKAEEVQCDLVLDLLCGVSRLWHFNNGQFFLILTRKKLLLTPFPPIKQPFFIMQCS